MLLVSDAYYRYISIKKATTPAIDHLRNVHGLAVVKKSKKKDSIVEFSKGNCFV